MSWESFSFSFQPKLRGCSELSSALEEQGPISQSSSSATFAPTPKVLFSMSQEMHLHGVRLENVKNHYYNL